MAEAAGNAWAQTRTLLVLAATETAAVEGISAAGSSPESRRQTAAADAELLMAGPLAARAHALPPLPAGVSPALISHVVLKELDLLASTLVVDLGCPVAPAIGHLRLPGQESGGPARCLSTGAAMPQARAAALLERGRRWGVQLAGSGGSQAGPPQPLLLAECVPGGTTTALAVLLGLGVDASGLVSGSLRQPAHALKTALVHQGLAAAGWLPPTGMEGPDPLALVAALGDPMQPLAAGLVLSAVAHGLPLVLAGGSQMAAVWALALAMATPPERLGLVQGVELATTAWVVGEAGSDLPLLLERIAERFGLARPLPLRVSRLHFRDCRSQALRDYELGYVKEGVGAGGLALIWERCGHAPEALAAACDGLCAQWLGA